MSEITMREVRLMFERGYTITVDNSAACSFNINIDSPTFFCYALSEDEAVGKMMRSNFTYKAKTILSIQPD